MENLAKIWVCRLSHDPDQGEFFFGTSIYRRGFALCPTYPGTTSSALLLNSGFSTAMEGADCFFWVRQVQRGSLSRPAKLTVKEQRQLAQCVDSPVRMRPRRGSLFVWGWELWTDSKTMGLAASIHAVSATAYPLARVQWVQKMQRRPWRNSTAPLDSPCAIMMLRTARCCGDHSGAMPSKRAICALRLPWTARLHRRPVIRHSRELTDPFVPDALVPARSPQ